MLSLQGVVHFTEAENKVSKSWRTKSSGPNIATALMNSTAWLRSQDQAFPALDEGGVHKISFLVAVDGFGESHFSLEVWPLVGCPKSQWMGSTSWSQQVKGTFLKGRT